MPGSGHNNDSGHGLSSQTRRNLSRWAQKKNQFFSGRSVFFSFCIVPKHYIWFWKKCAIFRFVSRAFLRFFLYYNRYYRVYTLILFKATQFQPSLHFTTSPKTHKIIFSLRLLNNFEFFAQIFFWQWKSMSIGKNLFCGEQTLTRATR